MGKIAVIELQEIKDIINLLNESGVNSKQQIKDRLQSIIDKEEPKCPICGNFLDNRIFDYFVCEHCGIGSERADWNNVEHIKELIELKKKYSKEPEDK